MENTRWSLFDYLDNQGRNIIKIWMLRLQKRERAKINVKLDMLESKGPDLGPKLLSDTKQRHIKKLRTETKSLALRLLLCKGPIENNREFTLLLGAIEKDWELIPKDAENLAEEHRKLIIADPSKRRCKHERVS